MNTIKISIAFFATVFFTSCGGEETVVTSHDEVKAVIERVEEVAEVIEEAEVVNTEIVNTDDLSKGVGPITALELTDIDDALVLKGKEIYKANCTACHKMKKRFVGPALDGVTSRRSPEWIMNMILNPEEMVEKDETAKALLMEYSAPMANQNLTEEEARAILEFFRSRN